MPQPLAPLVEADLPQMVEEINRLASVRALNGKVDIQFLDNSFAGVGLTALVEASDAMLKAANVTLIGWQKIGSGMVTALVVGDVAAVKAAVDAGSAAAGRVGEVVGVQVIPRPHEDLGAVLPLAGKKPAAAPAGV